MLVSIALCTYNGEDFLAAQLESILTQTHTQLEIIICDDASVDGTRSILEEYAAADNRVKLLWNETNLGPSRSFEKTVQFANGQYIAFADQDDIWSPEKIERMLLHMQSSLLLYHDSELVNEEGEKMDKRISNLRNLFSVTDTRGFVFSNCVWGHAIFFEKSLLQHLLPFPENIPHDIWTGFVATAVKGIQYLDEVLVQYRQHSRTVTTSLPPHKIEKRKLSQKEAEYQKTLLWIGVMKNFPVNPQIHFFQKLYSLYQQKEKGFSTSLFWFLLKNRRALFQFTKKSVFSQVNEIRKHSRGVKVEGN